MIWIDNVIAALVLITFISGFFRGFRLEVFSLAIWVLSIGVGLSFSREFSVFLESRISNNLPKITASFALLFLITQIVGSLIRMLLGESLKKTELTLMERLGGIIFGVLRGLVVLVLLVLLAGLTSLPDDYWWKESKLLPPFQIGAIWIRDHVPSALAEYIHYR